MMHHVHTDQIIELTSYDTLVIVPSLPHTYSYEIANQKTIIGWSLPQTRM